MNRKATKKVDESTLTTLCAVCRGAFLDAKGVRLRRADPRQLVKDVCTYCQTRYGQNTVEARRTCNGSKDVTIRCKVFYGLTKEDEATLFAIQTGNATCLTAGERLRANLVAENPDALYFVGITSNAGVEFAIIRCGFGMNQTKQDDAQWLNNVKGCEENNIPYGVYLYSYADTVEKAQSEAEHVLRLIKGHTLTYPVYYDIEEKTVLNKLTAEQLGKIAATFVNKVKAEGYQTGIYSNKSNFETFLTDSQFSQWNKWVAQYNSPSCTYKGTYQIWQAADTGTIDGGNGAVDIDFAMKTISSSDNNPGTSTEKPATSATKPTTTAAKNNTRPAPVKLRIPTIKVKSSAKKKAQIIWNLKGNGVKYQVYYSTKKNKGYKKAATINSSKGKATVKKLKSKKKYYFKVRCSKTVKGHTYYSAYSKIKSIKIK